MTKPTQIVVGIDVGTSKIVTMVAGFTSDNAPWVNVLGVASAPANGIKSGQIVDINSAVTVINASLEAAERMAGHSASHAVVSISGKHIESQNSRGVVAVSSPEREISQNDITRVLEAAKAISLPTAREVIHVIPRMFIVDGQEGIKDPIGMTGVRLEVDTHIVSANSTALNNLVKAIEEVGVDVDDVIFSGYGSSLAVLSTTEKDLGVVLVDIGAGTTDICIFIEGSLSYSSVLPIGARHISNDLAIGLRISFESAEKIKLFLTPKKSKTVLTPEVLAEKEEKTAKEVDEIDLAALGMAEEIRKVSKKTLIEGIIKPRLNEIFTMVGLEIKKSGFGGQTPSGVVLTGGGALTVGAPEAAKKMLSMPVRVAVPQEMNGLIDEIEHPSFATAVGLVKYAGMEIDEQAGLPFGLAMPK
ncbi:cell division protein FtsA, partial [Candidatus Microgenomates bacterium]|nr:cell division protein FtsA [Candidatus Microgenomates bacterium]